MAVIIQNMDGKERSTYEVRINYRVITSFKHDRADGLAVCLEKAAKAVREHDEEVLRSGRTSR